jgi:hypothetical protein
MNALTPETALTLAESLHAKFRGAEAAQATAELEAHYPEILAAVDSFVQLSRVDEARRLTAAWCRSGWPPGVCSTL